MLTAGHISVQLIQRPPRPLASKGGSAGAYSVQVSNGGGSGTIVHRGDVDIGHQLLQSDHADEQQGAIALSGLSESTC
eukprot:COSAG02_NODE_384_length_23406_cov_9.459733_7_plen_78_part_00